jgi:hypothetical protein
LILWSKSSRCELRDRIDGLSPGNPNLHGSEILEIA